MKLIKVLKGKKDKIHSFRTITQYVASNLNLFDKNSRHVTENETG
jgi:hypothetical protein